MGNIFFKSIPWLYLKIVFSGMSFFSNVGGKQFPHGYIVKLCLKQSNEISSSYS